MALCKGMSECIVGRLSALHFERTRLQMSEKKKVESRLESLTLLASLIKFGHNEHGDESIESLVSVI